MHSFFSAGIAISYLDEAPFAAASAPPVLLIHGFGSSIRINWATPGWVATLRNSGRRVVALDNRGHGNSGKPHDPASYATTLMAGDALRLLDHLGIAQADVMGYSMGARITAFLALGEPARVRRIVLGGLGIHLVQGAGLPMGIAEAMEAPSPGTLTDPMQRMFRAFADQGGNDRIALAACIRGSRQSLTAAGVARIKQPALVAVGTADDVAGEAAPLAALLPQGRLLDIPGRDHNRAVGDRLFKSGVLAFLDA